MSSLSIVINRLCFRSLWKLNCIVVSTGMVPLGMLIGIYAWISGADIVSINDQYVYGPTALITAISFSFFLSFIFGTFWTIVQWFGFIIYSRLRPIRLRYYEIKQSKKDF